MKTKKRNSAIFGAAFLMATSAVGPGFLTQTTVFTEKLAASFGFVIFLSVLLDIGAQLNIWRVLVVSNKRAQNVANALVPGAGFLLSALVVMGGLAFNIGNIAGAGLGLESFLGIEVKTGAIISALVVSVIFLQPDMGRALDYFTRFMALLILLLIAYTFWVSAPPLAGALRHTFMPEIFDARATVTLVGGTVGGYITFAGAHRLIDAGVHGQKSLGIVNRSAATGILIASIIRYFLFLAALGVLAAGAGLNAQNPAASVFEYALPKIGEQVFGLLMWSAALTSVVGAAYTSVSFLKKFERPRFMQPKWLTLAMVWVSTLAFIFVGKPVKTLIFVGMLNGFILPIGLALMLIAAGKKSIVGEYKNPLVLQIVGWAIVAVMTVLSLLSIF